MKKRLISIAIAMIMCFSLTAVVTAYGDDKTAAADHEVFYVHYNVEQVASDFGIEVSSSCSHYPTSVKQTPGSTVSTHLVSYAGSLCYCTVTSYYTHIETFCGGSGNCGRIGSSYINTSTHHTISHN